MKKMLLSLILILILSEYAIPQNIIFEALASEYRQSDIYSAEFINSLNKTSEQKGGAYKLSNITVDSTLKITFTYDSNWKLSSYSKWELSGNTWNEASRDEYTYDERGNIYTHCLKTAVNGNWHVFNIEYYTYDGSNRLTMKIDSLLSYDTVKRTLYSYNDKGLRTATTDQEWLNDAWVNKFRTSYSYDSFGNRVEIVEEEGDKAGWVNYNKLQYSYDNNNRMITYLYQVFRNDQWKNFFREAYTYDAEGNNTGMTHDIFSTNGWENSSNYSYTYDSNGDMTSSVTERWNTGEWNRFRKTNYYYDGSRNCIKVMSFKWDMGGWIPAATSLGTISYNCGKDKQSFPPGAVICVEYVQTTGVDEETAITKSFLLEQNYPNPFNSSTTISYSIMREGHVKLSVYDALGRQMTVLADENKPAGKYSVRFNADGYPSGVYFCRLESGRMSLSRKLILLK